MAIEAEVVTFTRTTGDGTGNQVVSLSGSFTPKAVVFISNFVTSNGIESGAVWGIGFATDSTHECSICGLSEDAQPDSDTAQQGASARCIVAKSHDQADVSYAEFVSVASGSFTINWTNLDLDIRVHALVLGGDDITDAYVGTEQMDDSTNPQPITGVGFEPDLVLFANPNWFGSQAGQTTGLGAMDGSGNQFCIATWSKDNSPTTNAHRTQRTDKAIYLVSHSGTLWGDGAYSSMESDGFNINWSTEEGKYFGFLCLKGVSLEVGHFDVTTGGSSQDVATGFNPAAVLLASFNHTDTDTTQDGVELSVGISDGINHGSIWFGDAHGEADSLTDSSSRDDRPLELISAGTPTVDEYITGVTMGTNKFTLAWNGTPSTAFEIGYVAFGGGAAAEPGVYIALRGIVTN